MTTTQTSWRQRADEVDGIVRSVAADAVSGPVVVLAVGGYGRRELCPASDVDLLIVHDGLAEAQLEAIVRAVVYPLWDHKLTVGYAVRDRWDALSSMDDLDSATAMLDMRVLAGDVNLAQRLRTESTRRLRRRPERFLHALRAADVARQAKFGDAAEVLEPDLKSGAGGLRDVQSLRWAAVALVGTIGLDPLVAAAYISAADRMRLAHAEAFLLRVRVALHAAIPARQATNVLRVDLHDVVAASLGYTDSETALAPHALLNDLYVTTRTIAHIHGRAWRLIESDLAGGQRRRTRSVDRFVDGFALFDGVLGLGEVAIDAPDLPVRLFAALVDTGAMLDRQAADLLRAHAERTVTGWWWTAAARDRFFATLWRGSVVLPALAELDDAGVFTAMLPGWSAVRGRAQRNPYHRFALDRHAWHTVTHLAESVRRESWAAEELEEVTDRHALIFGALVHDVGKAFGEPHEESGVAVAETMARHLGMPESSVIRVGSYVRLHLVLPQAARTRDIADTALAAELAGGIGDRDMLAGLHLLAVADARATGPTVHNDWIGSLLRSLTRRVRAVLEDTHPDDLADGAVATARAAQQLATELGATADDVRAHLGMLSTRYAAAMTPRAVVRHTLMASSPLGPSEVRTRVTPHDGAADAPEGIDELDVVAMDNAGLFAKVAGVISLHDGEIAAADAFTRDDGVAVDTFRVRPPSGATSSWWAHVEGDLVDAVAGRLAVRARVGRVARAEQRRIARLPEIETKIAVESDASGRATVIEVRTQDRSGVLYAITSAFAELQVDLVIARIDTVGYEAVDVFTCRNADGEPLDDAHVAEIELAIVAALNELDAQ